MRPEVTRPGLGLPHVAAFMPLINGHVGIASEQGLGTTVSLYFPSAEANEDVPTAG
jgi:signal transduction histidine kinase